MVRSGGSYGKIRRKLLLFDWIDAVGWIISETPVKDQSNLNPGA